MNNKKLIRFVESFLFFPIITVSMPLGILSNPEVDTNIISTPQIVLSQTNIEANGFLAFNQVENQKAEEQKSKAHAIDSYFKLHDMPLEGYGLKMVQEAEKNGLDWSLLAALSVIETTGGKNLCSNPKGQNNPFGWGSCKIGFKNFDEAIEVIAQNLGGNDPDTEHHYADKTTVKEILQTYNPPSVVQNYANKVMRVMREIEKRFVITAEV